MTIFINYLQGLMTEKQGQLKIISRNVPKPAMFLKNGDEDNRDVTLTLDDNSRIYIKSREGRLKNKI